MTTPEKDEIEALRSQGLTRQQIADHYGVNISQVKRWISGLQVTKKIVRKPSEHKPTRPSRGAILPEDDGLTVLEKAKRILGPRFAEKKGIGYTVDGRIVNTDELLSIAGVPYPARNGW